MLDFITKGISKIFGTKSSRDIKQLLPIVDQINAEYEKLKSLSNDELRNKTAEFRAYIAEKLKEINTEIDSLTQQAEDESKSLYEKEDLYKEIDELVKNRDKELEEVLNEILPQAFAVVKETAFRFTNNKELKAKSTDMDKDLAAKHPHIVIEGENVSYQNKWIAAGNEVEWNMVHYDVQLIGGIVLHQGKISEMATGEGKTLVATLPAYLNALPSYGVHVVTVNTYLSRRDAEWNEPIFNFLGITVDCIDRYEPHSEQRKKAYRADITYGTNNEFGFDYLRDNMAHNSKDQVQKKLHFAMIDEVDSVLIDDARTPLIISGPVPRGDEQEFHALRPRIQKLVEAQKREVTKFLQDAKKMIAEGRAGYKEGEGGLALLRAHRGLPKSNSLIKYLSEEGVKQVLNKTENFYLQDQQKEMPTVDKELYFTIEERNNQIELTDKGIELITQQGEDPNFFIMPDVGLEVAKIDNSDLDPDEKLAKKDALMQDFSIKSERIHAIQQLLKAYTLFEKDVEYVVMEGKVKIVDEQTGRIMEGRRYSDGLHQAIEAKENVKVEAATQTFATVSLQNFFRMYHKLCGMTGTAETEAGEFWEIYKLDVVVIPTNRDIVRNDYEDKVYKTKREKFASVIDEIVRLSGEGRPVLVGTTSVEISELLSKMLTMNKIKHNVLNAKQHQREAEIVAEAGKPGNVTIATNMAGRGTDIKLGEGVKDKGGLAIIGTERHDSRRVDRQLRGRAGRQGDPGSSQFFVSLEDNLMRIFGSDTISSVMDKMGYKEGEVIQHSMITKSIERAQKKVEENNFGSRKRLLEYDDVMNSQRDVIYKRRQHALDGDRLSFDLMNMFYDMCDEVVISNKTGEDYDNFKLEVIRYFSTDTKISEQDFKTQKAEEISSTLFEEIESLYLRKSDKIAKNAFIVIQRLFENRGHEIKRIIIPFTDGFKTLNAMVDLESAYKSECKNVMKEIEKSIVLALIDQSWKDHLRQMDELRQSVQLAVHEQKDPLLIYKLEAFNLFKGLLNEINKDVVSFLFKGSLPIQDEQELKQAREERSNREMANLKEGRGSSAAIPSGGGESPHSEPTKAEPVRVGPKVGRNDPCPCGSGKKYKQCHGKDE
jgi:preprotein translocase subunit SecA